MKRFNLILIILMCCLGTASFTSCIDGDDNGGIDPTVYKQYLNSISGSYYGGGSDWRQDNKLYFYNDTIKGNTTAEKTDSVSSGISGTFRTDSTFTIYGVPGRVLAKEFPEAYNDLKKAIEESPAQQINGTFIFGITGPTSYMQMFNTSVNYPTLTYGGKTHNNISIMFWGGNSSYGVYGYFNSHKMIELNLYMAAVYEGDTKLFDIYNGTSTGLQMNKANLFIRVTQ